MVIEEKGQQKEIFITKTKKLKINIHKYVALHSTVVF